MTCEKNADVEALRLAAEGGRAQFETAAKQLIGMGYTLLPQPDGTVYVYKTHLEEYGVKFVPAAKQPDLKGTNTGSTAAYNGGIAGASNA